MSSIYEWRAGRFKSFDDIRWAEFDTLDGMVLPRMQEESIRLRAWECHLISPLITLILQEHVSKLQLLATVRYNGMPHISLLDAFGESLSKSRAYKVKFPEWNKIHFLTQQVNQNSQTYKSFPFMQVIGSMPHTDDMFPLKSQLPEYIISRHFSKSRGLWIRALWRVSNRKTKKNRRKCTHLLYCCFSMYRWNAAPISLNSYIWFCCPRAAPDSKWNDDERRKQMPAPDSIFHIQLHLRLSFILAIYKWYRASRRRLPARRAVHARRRLAREPGLYRQPRHTLETSLHSRVYICSKDGT